MLIDNPQLMDKSRIGRTAAANGSVFPGSPLDGAIFEIVGGSGITDGVYIYSERITDWVLTENNYDGAYDIGMTIFDRPRANEIVAKHLSARTFFLFADFAGSIAKSTIAAEASSVFTLNLISGGNTAAIGTITFGAGSTDGVFSSTGGLAVVVGRGSIIQVVSPEVRDGALSSIDITLAGKLILAE